MKSPSHICARGRVRAARFFRGLALHLIPGTAFLLSCADAYNPFNDHSLALVHILHEKSPLGNADSILIFSTDTLFLAATVPGLIDSFTIGTQSNRYWTDTTIRHPTSADYPFAVCFVDTGIKTILVTTWRVNGRRADERHGVRAVSPLAQTPISAALSEEVVLRTVPVGDDVWYHWSYGRNLIDTVSSFVHQISHSFNQPGAFTGRLWVSLDSTGHICPSPPVTFTINVNDNAGPFVSCLNDSLRGDTIITGDDLFVLAFHISDPGGVEAALLDGKLFEFANPPVYRQTISTTVAHAVQPRVLEIRAYDHNGNMTTRVYFVRYDENGPRSTATRLILDVVDNDVSAGQTYTIAGKVEDHTRDTVFISSTVNGKAFRENRETVLQEGRGLWSLTITLGESHSTIVVITATDGNGTVLARETMTIIYDPEAIDTRPPTILEIRVDGRLAPVNKSQQPFLSRSNAATITVAAFDQAGIASVLLNGNPMTGLQTLIWQGPLTQILHTVPREAGIAVTDEAGNTTPYVFLVQRNTAPVVDSAWQWPRHLIAGAACAIDLPVIDIEDAVTVWLENAPAGLAAQPQSGQNEWKLIWQPQPSDTGEHRVSVWLDDGLEATVYDWTFSVLNDTSGYVRFATRPSDFPRFVEAGTAFQGTLAILPGTGTPPYRYGVSLESPPAILLNTANQPDEAVAFTWQPSTDLLGNRRLTATIVDSHATTDTLILAVEVVPANAHPCALAVISSEPLVYNRRGEVAMTEASGPVTLTFTIVDDDHPSTERHTLTIISNGITTTQVVDQGAGFDIVIDNQSGDLLDTIHVMVSDLTGSTDSRTYRISYLPLPSHDVSLSLELPPHLTMSPQNVISMSGAAHPETLVVRIEDQDHPLSERYSIAITRDGTTTTSTIDDRQFFTIIVDKPGDGNTADFRVVVRDCNDSVDTLSFSATWRIAKKIVINTAAAGGGADIQANLYEFPILIRLDTHNFDFASVTADAPGLEFVSRSGSSLPFEIGTWDSSGQNAAVWVGIDTVFAGNADQHITMHFDRPAPVSGSGGTSIFDTSNGFAGVWHLDTDLMLDATSNSINGLNRNTTDATGMAGRGRSFNGINAWIDLGTNNLLSATPAFTLSAWIRPTSLFSDIGFSGIISFSVNSQSGESSVSRGTMFMDSIGNLFGMVRAPDTGMNNGAVTSTPVITTGKWTFVAVVIDLANNSAALYTDGILRASQAFTLNNSITDNTPSSHSSIGSQDDGSDGFFSGEIDEVVVSRRVRPAAWLKLCYENQKPGSTVVTVW